MKGAIVGIGGGGFLMDDTRLLQERYPRVAAVDPDHDDD